MTNIFEEMPGNLQRSSSALARLFFISVIALLLTPLSAQDRTPKLRFRFEIRQRFEAWNGMNMKNYGDDRTVATGSLNDRLLYQRITAGADYQASESLRFVFRIQDSRAFGWSLSHRHYPDLFKVRATGTESPYYTLNPNEEFFEIGETYAEYSVNRANLTIRVGRQNLIYGDSRVFASADWNNTGRWTWDAVKLSYRHNSQFVDAFFGGTKTHDPLKLNIPFAESEFIGGGIYGHLEFKKGLPVVEPFILFKKEGTADYIRDRDISRYWSGFRIYSNAQDRIVYDATAVKQWGSQDGKSIDAYGWAVKLGYRFGSLPARPVLYYRNTYASGGSGTSLRIRSFDPAYGGNSSYNGRMNIIPWSNMTNSEFALECTPWKGASAEIAFHHLGIPYAEGTRLLGTMEVASGNHFGNEFNVFLRYKLSDNWHLISLFGYFRPGNLIDINGSPPKSASLFSFQVLYTR